MFFRSLFLATLIAAGTASAATIIVPNNGSSVFFQETTGTPGTTTRSLGETFTVPAPTSENQLTEFDFSFANGTESTFDYRFYIFQWDAVNVRATGPALYQSAVRNGTQAPTFTGLNLVLNPALTYIALLTTQGAVNDSFSNGLLNHNSNNVYAGGQAFSQSSAVAGNTGTGTWTSASWSAVNGNSDFQFTAIFTPASSSAPEPSTILGAGAALAIALTRLRRRQP